MCTEPNSLKHLGGPNFIYAEGLIKFLPQLAEL